MAGPAESTGAVRRWEAAGPTESTRARGLGLFVVIPRQRSR